MKTYNQVIKIEVSIDAIAQNVLKALDKDFAHRELFTEAIIGTAMNSNTMHHIYGALTGFTGDINFTVGQEVLVNEKFKTNNNYELVEGRYTYQNKPIVKATVKDIDIYRSEKVEIEYAITTARGDASTETRWIDHSMLSGIEECLNASKEILVEANPAKA